MSEAPTFDTGATREKEGGLPRFYLEAAHGPMVEGKPTFIEREMVEILLPADRNTAWAGIVNDEIRSRFPRQYAAWKEGREEPTEGTPLNIWAGVTRAQVEELTFNRVKTVEQLAELTDQGLQNAVRMGGFALREKAQRYLESMQGAAGVEKLAAENERLTATMTQTTQALNAALDRIKALEANQDKAPPPSV